MAKLTLNDVGNFNSTGLGVINDNSDKIVAALENTLSLDGTSPNQMAADLDLNHNDIINVDNVNAAHIIADDFTLGSGESFEELIDRATDAADTATNSATAAATSETNAAGSATRAEAAAASVEGLKFPTIAEAEAYTPVTAPDFIETAGYASAGDGGGALYAGSGSTSGDLVITLSDGTTQVGYDIVPAPRSVRAYGAPGTAGNSSTMGIQAAWDAVKAETPQSSELDFPVGRYETGTISLDRIGSDAGNRLSLHGVGQGSFMVMSESPNTNVFELSGTGSYSVNIQGLRFGVATQSDNVNAAAIAARYGAYVTTTGDTTASSATVTVADATGIIAGMLVTGTGVPDDTYVTDRDGTTITLSNAATATGSGVALTFNDRFTVLDFQYSDLYVNGIPRGITGPHVSGIITNVLFDFMTDRGISAPNKDFRKIEIVADHFYKTKDYGIYVDGTSTNSGGTTSQTHRDDASAAGHLTITGSGFDRYMDTAVSQKMVFIETADNIAAAGNWFNGKTPGEADTGTFDAMHWKDVNNAAIAAQTAYYMDRGFYFEDCSNLSIAALTIRKGNMAGNATTAGAVTFDGCSDINGVVNIHESGGLGLLLLDCSDITLIANITMAQLSAIYMSNCKRVKIIANVQDANQADSLSGNTETSGVYLTGGSGTECEDCEITLNASLSSADQGQRDHIVIGTNALRTKVIGGHLGAARTGYRKFTDNGTDTEFIGVGGVVTRNGGEVTISNPATNVTVNHGLDRTPESHEIEANLRADASGVTRWWIDQVTSASFRINVNATPTTAATFAWRAETR